MAGKLKGSEILKIAASIRALVRDGVDICNLTVGDFSPEQFRVPGLLADGIRAALERGETNYPPAIGVRPLREAVQRFYARELGLEYPLESIAIASGARPLIYGVYRTLIDPGDKVVYPVPSWNNNHYCTLLQARGVPVRCGPEHRFLPTAEALVSELPGARLVCMNSPLNPTGTAITRDALRGICEAIVAENERRAARGEKPVYLLYDHIYWMLTFGETRHFTPVEVVPEMARYTIFIDGISKAFAATGLRVGWAVGPVDVLMRMTPALGHVGAWAPRPEQLASALLLDDPEGVRAYHREFKPAIRERLDLLHEGVQALKREGLPVDSIPPMGAIYLTVKLAPFGRVTPSGQVLRTNEDVRAYLLERANLGIVPFQAFGYPGDEGWFRMSVGAVGPGDIRRAMPLLGDALRALRPA
ncbi:MAG: aminotransferase class I/II-fold pyridoxal phosphate-dependent enzyme [Myxococcales bacterium]|nr:aminotransferase class I/II-fold pyridoxal phosphate-dependent enzyme [Myxococcales bacterium]